MTIHLNKVFSALIAGCVAFGAFAGNASACTACFNGGADVPITEALNGAIFMMFGMLGLVLGGFVAFMVYLYKKAGASLPEHALMADALNREGAQ